MRTAECTKCHQDLPIDDFDVNLSAGRKRQNECKACKHQRLAKKHNLWAAHFLEIRRRRRDYEHAKADAAREVAGKD